MPRQIDTSFVTRHSSHVKSIFLCLISASLSILSFPPFNIWLFAWFGFVPLFFVLQTKSKWKAFFLSYFAGIIFWSGIIYWLVHVTLPGTVALILYLALYFGIFGLIASDFRLQVSGLNLVFIPSVWVLLEYIRSHLLTGFGWAILGYSQYLNLPIIQIADITGVWGVSFLVMMVNVVIWQVILQATCFKSQVSRILFNYLPFILCFLCILGYGYYSLYLRPATSDLRRLKISVIQGNIPQELKWEPSARVYILDKYTQLTEQATNTNPDLIVWPEASSPGLLGEDDEVFQDIFSLGKKIKIPLLIGTVARDNEKYFNSALLIDNSGRISGRYDKLHLVPFGEYIPLKRFLPFLETVVPIGDITAGGDYTIFKIPNPKSQIPSEFAVLICFEDLFPQISREFVKRGANFLINITNDAWYKQTAAPYQHFQASVFRAVENRVFLVRSANTGVSGFIAPNGKIVSLVQDKTGREIFIEGYKTQEITIQKTGLSFYTRYGDIFIVGCFLLALYGIIPPFKSKQ